MELFCTYNKSILVDGDSSICSVHIKHGVCVIWKTRIYRTTKMNKTKIIIYLISLF